MKDLYKGVAEIYAQTPTKKLLLIPAIKRAIPKNTNKKLKSLLDIGCGTADFYKTTTALGYKYHGLDRSESMLSVARTRHPLVNFSSLSATNFVYKYKMQFDIALLVLILQDNIKENVIKIIKETNKSLKKSGLVVIGIHHPNFDHYMRFGLLNKTNVKTDFKGYFKSDQKYILKYNYDHNPANFIDYHLTLQDYFEIFLKSGFEIISIDECPPNPKFKDVLKKKLKEKGLYPTYMVITLKKH